MILRYNKQPGPPAPATEGGADFPEIVRRHPTTQTQFLVNKTDMASARHLAVLKMISLLLNLVSLLAFVVYVVGLLRQGVYESTGHCPATCEAKECAVGYVWVDFENGKNVVHHLRSKGPCTCSFPNPEGGVSVVC